MGVYEKWILPRLTDLAMRNREATRYRSLVVPQARGKVLEIGVGTGLNLPHYPPEVQRICTVDPNPGMRKRMARRAVWS